MISSFSSSVLISSERHGAGRKRFPCGSAEMSTQPKYAEATPTGFTKARPPSSRRRRGQSPQRKTALNLEGNQLAAPLPTGGADGTGSAAAAGSSADEAAAALGVSFNGADPGADLATDEADEGVVVPQLHIAKVKPGR